MKSPRAFSAAIALLLMLLLAALYQALFDHGVETFIHAVLAAGSLLVASAVFDFNKVAAWMKWTACLLIGVEGAIVLVQGASHLSPTTR